jgi:LmbE family N-acetylglucosaminyl deacetylase
MTRIGCFDLAPDGGRRAIPEIAMPVGLRLLVLAPHPDDFDAIGVTLRFLWRQGHALDVAVFRTGSGVEDVYRPGLSLDGKADLREEEQRRSVRFFGLSEDRLRFLRLAADGEDQPLDNSENRAAIAALLAEKEPDIVFLPHYSDTNSGHRAMHALFRDAAGKAGRPWVALLNRDPKTIVMRTDLYMPFGPDEAAWKAELLRFHDSQQQRNLRTRGHGFDERILASNRAAAGELALDCEYAEAFEVEACDCEKGIARQRSYPRM